MFLGRVSREQMPLYMKAADYVALYSGYEGLSHTLLESLRVGTPVIASDKGGNPEVVQHGVNGLLVPYVDVEALAAALEEAFRPGVRDSLAANSAVGMDRFDFGRMVESTAAALERYSPGDLEVDLLVHVGERECASNRSAVRWLLPTRLHPTAAIRRSAGADSARSAR